MKGSNDFVYFLVGGLAIIALLMLFLGANIYKFGGSNLTKQPGIIEAVKTFDIPVLQASNMIDTRSTDLVDRNVYNGLLFGEDKIIYNLTKSSLQDVTLKFTVVDTNSYGRLRISVNGHLLENKVFYPGQYEIKIPADMISDSMIIEVASENSYWKIWAPTVYKIEDASLTFTSYFSEASQYKFYLGEEYQNMEFAKVDIALDENIGTLIVDLNGRTIWNSPVNNLQSITLDKADLRLGDNVIKFRSAEDSRFTGRGVIAVIFLTRYPETINQTGTVTAVQPFIGVTTQFNNP